MIPLIFGSLVILSFDATAHTNPYGKIVAEIRVSELRWTKEDVILRELASQVGKPYSKENAEKDLQRLHRLDLFSSFDIDARVDGDEVVLEIEVEESYPLMVFPALNYTDENGFSIGPGARTFNFRGRGVTVGATAMFGGQTSVGFVASNPWLFGNHIGLSLETGWRRRENVLGDFEENSVRIALTPSSYIGENGRIGGRIEFEGLKSDEPGTTLSEDGTDELPTLALFVGYDSRDVWSSPTRGWLNELEVAKTSGDANFWTVTFDVRRYQPVKENHILFFSSLTTLRTGELGVEVPDYFVYSFGGTNSVRGWEFDSRRGNNQFLNTLEYRYDIVPLTGWHLFGLSLRSGLQIALFGDLGVLWDEPNQFATRNFIGGFGVGVRALMTGVGMFRLDFGWGQSGTKVQFGFGVFEKADAQRKRVR